MKNIGGNVIQNKVTVLLITQPRHSILFAGEFLLKVNETFLLHFVN